MIPTTPVISQELQVISEGVRTFASVWNAYKECTPDVQEIVDDMVVIVNDPDSTSDEKEHALDTMLEALFPGLMNDLVEGFKSHRRSSAGRAIRTSLQKEEASFASRLARLMKDRRISQAELAKLIGVQQPAVSMMLKRGCRPQRKTILRLAKALKAEPGDLWPNTGDDPRPEAK
jgi:predicted XRE-type DNA-binding protein